MYNIPRVVDVTVELQEWIYSCDNLDRLMNTSAKNIPEYVRRFTQDIYMCVYVNPDLDMYGVNLPIELSDVPNSTTMPSGDIQKSHENLITITKKEYRKLQDSHARLKIKKDQLKKLQNTLVVTNQKKEETITYLSETNEQLQAELVKQKELLVEAENTSCSWKFSHTDIEDTKIELGRGGWAEVTIGNFHRKTVAIKRLYKVLIEQKEQNEHYLDLLHREINTMSQLRHPNLLQFIGAVLDHPSGNPMIITEVMDTSLRKAYESKELTPDPSCRPVILSIMRDVAVGLNYLHCLPDPIIHRDISSANVLLESKGPRKWKTKISDFGSANFARAAVTAAPGAAIYSAPESIVTLYRKEKDQTTKMDSYSYGVLLCEVIMCQFPSDAKIFDGLLQQVKTSSSKLYELIVSCISEEPEKRPTISHVIEQLDC